MKTPAKRRYWGVLGILFLATTVGAASPNVGKITRMDGEVQIFSSPSKDVKGPPPHALYENEYYSVKVAKVGDEVDQGNIVRTGPGGVAKVVFENGDQIHVGPATAYRIFWNEKGETSKTSVNLLYGKLRNVVSKVGPRNNMEVKTSDVTMGVRGTDFYVSRRGSANKTEVTTLRGAVAVSPKAEDKKTKVETVEVKPGQTAVVVSASPTVEKSEKKESEVKVAPKVEVRKTHQEDLQSIQAISVVKPKEELKVSSDVKREVEKLEKKAVETTLQDIKTSDPKLFAEVSKKDMKSLDELSTTTVKKALETAPPAPKKMKPTERDLDEGVDSYDKYFKRVD